MPPARHPASLGRAAAVASGGARRARIQFYEHGLGDWMRVRRVPDGRLSGLLLDRELLGYQHSRAEFASWLEPPRPELTLMIDLDGGLTANGERLPDAWIGGLDDRPTIVGFGGTYGAIDLKLTPLGAYTLVGLPLRELARACVPLRDVFGPEGDELVARVRTLDDWDERFDVLEAFLLRRLHRNPAARVPGAGGHNAERLRAAAHPRGRRHRRPLPLIQDRGSATG
jgi:hypothetical protein